MLEALVLPAHFYKDDDIDIDYEGLGLDMPQDYQVKDIYVFQVSALLPRPKSDDTCLLYAHHADCFTIDLPLEETLRRINAWITKNK